MFTGAKYKCEIQMYEINANDHHGPLHSVIYEESKSRRLIKVIIIFFCGGGCAETADYMDYIAF